MTADAEEPSLAVPACLHLVSAFLAMEPPAALLSLARLCGGGSITESVQRFIWDQCVSKADRKCHAPYLKSFLKKLIVDSESRGVDVLDELYERYASYMTILKDDDVAKGNSRVLKCISYLFPEDRMEVPSCPKSMQLVIPLECSLNMLEGDTGCSIWPSSLFLTEFILSCPEIFTNKSCFEVGSGVGLVGICLAHVKASKIVLSDGDLSSLANLKINLEQNQLNVSCDLSERNSETNMVQCKYLPWESATENELQDLKADIILGADVIYDPLCLPHLVRVLGILLSRDCHPSNSCQGSQPSNNRISFEASGADCTYGSEGSETAWNSDVKRSDFHNNNGAGRYAETGGGKCDVSSGDVYPSYGGAVAYIASVIRNIDTCNCFLALADQANLKVTDITDEVELFNLLPYMESYHRSGARLFTVTYVCK